MATIKTLKSTLPNPGMEVEYDLDDENVEEVRMEQADVKNFGKGGASMSGGEYDSDDEGAGGPGNVQCQQS